MHVDGQTVAAMSIVAVAAGVIGRRMYGQIAAFWTTDKSSHCGGCEGCGPKSAAPKASTQPQLVQLQLRPPARIKRPSNDEG